MVHVSSRLCKNGFLNPKDIDGNDENGGQYSLWKRYGTAKLSQIAYSNELHRRFARDALPVTSNAVTPGVVDTELGRFMGLPLQILSWPVRKCLMRTPVEGSLAVVQAALEPALEAQGGNFLGEDGLRVEVKPEASDATLAAALWEAWATACGGRLGAQRSD